MIFLVWNMTLLKYSSYETSLKAVSLPMRKVSLVNKCLLLWYMRQTKQSRPWWQRWQVAWNEVLIWKFQLRRRFKSKNTLPNMALCMWFGEFPEDAFKESATSGLKMAYTNEVKQRIKACKDPIVNSLSSTKMCHPLIVGAIADKEI